MEKRKREQQAWMVFTKAVLLAFGLYLVMQMLLSLLTVKGILPESRSGIVQLFFCALAAALGSGFAIRRCGTMGSLSCALTVTGCFLGVLSLIGLAAYGSFRLSGRGGLLLLAGLLGGILAGLLGGRRRPAGKRAARNVHPGKRREKRNHP